MAIVQQSQTLKYLEIDPPQPGNSVSAVVQDISAATDSTCSWVQHTQQNGTSVTWSKSGHVFPAFGSKGWKETWTPPLGATYQSGPSGKVRIAFGGGRDPKVYDAIVTETFP